jgi:hypothetical protein
MHPTTWCGYCKDEFEVDDEWIDRYLESKRSRLLSQVGRPYPYGLTREQAADILADYVKQLSPWRKQDAVRPR